MAEKLISGGKNRARQIRAVRKDGWTEAKRRQFLVHLAATCNVRQSVAAAGMLEDGAYALRNRDPEFAAQWLAAIDQGYATIEAALMARALAAPTGVLPERQPGDPVPPDAAAMDEGLAMKLMALRGQAARTKRIGSPPKVATKKELTEALLARIARVKAHRARGE